MQADTDEDRRVVAFLEQRIQGSADNAVVAEAIIAMLEGMNTTLVPIIGSKGVAALYRHSLFLCIHKKPALATLYEPFVIAMDLAPFGAMLREQNRNDALCLGETLLKTTYELLATLIGPSLSARLLHGVWDISSSAPSAQELLP